MRKLFALALAATTLLATPAAAVDLGIAVSEGATGSTSSAGAATQGSSASALLGFSAQQSSAGAQSAGSGTSLVSGNDSQSSSNHTSIVQQQGSNVSLGLAGAQNSSTAVGTGQSAAANQVNAIYLFFQP